MIARFLSKFADERFLMHRLRSTSIAGMATVLVTAGFFFWHLFHHQIEWELFAIVMTSAVVKVSCMLWFRSHD